MNVPVNGIPARRTFCRLIEIEVDLLDPLQLAGDELHGFLNLPLIGKALLCIEGQDGNVKVFDGSDSYEIELEATGYPAVKGTVTAQ